LTFEAGPIVIKINSLPGHSDSDFPSPDNSSCCYYYAVVIISLLLVINIRGLAV